MKRTIDADAELRVVREFLTGSRKFPMVFYPRVFGEKADYVIEHEPDFVKVKITVEFEDNRSGRKSKSKQFLEESS